MNGHNKQIGGHNKLNLVHLFSGITVTIILFLICFAAGYGLALLVFMVTGTPVEIIRLLISGLLGFCVFLVLCGLFRFVHHNIYHKNKPEKYARDTFFQRIIDAMDSIAQGDFSVLLATDENDPLFAIVESVNKMASELGSMESLRQDFISNVSHEIQSPLTSISGFAELLKNEDLTTEQREHYIEIIETEAKRLSKLSENLLKLSQLDSNAMPLAFSEFSLDNQIKNAVLMLEPQWSEKNINLSLDLEAVSISGDEDLLAQVWINLLQNAIKFTPEQGEIFVALEERSEAIVCSFADSGIGMSEEECMHIFERFYKADTSRERSSGGSGLGLSLVKTIIDLHEGGISVQSLPQEGSTFFIAFPKSRKEEKVSFTEH